MLHCQSFENLDEIQQISLLCSVVLVINESRQEQFEFENEQLSMLGRLGFYVHFRSRQVGVCSWRSGGGWMGACQGTIASWGGILLKWSSLTGRNKKNWEVNAVQGPSFITRGSKRNSTCFGRSV